MAFTYVVMTPGQVERLRLRLLAQLARDQGRSVRQVGRLLKRSPAWVTKYTRKVSAADCRKFHRPKREGPPLTPEK